MLINVDSGDNISHFYSNVRELSNQSEVQSLIQDLDLISLFESSPDRILEYDLLTEVNEEESRDFLYSFMKYNKSHPSRLSSPSSPFEPFYQLDIFTDLEL